MGGFWTLATRSFRLCSVVTGCVMALGVTAGWTSSACAEDWTGLENRVLSLDDCLAIAEQNSPSLGISQAEVLNAEATVTAAWSGILPTLSNETYLARSEYLRIRYWEGLGFDPIQSRNSYSNTLRLRQTLFDGGGNIARMAGARAGRRSSESRYHNSRQDLTLDVKTKYIELLQTKALLQVRQDAVDLSRQHLERADAFFTAGEKTRADVLRARVELAQNELELISAQNAVHTARAELAHSMGIPVEVRIDVRDLDVSVRDEAPDLEEDLSAARRDHPLLEAQRASIASAEESMKVAKSARWPSLGGYCNFSWQDFERPAFEGLHQWNAQRNSSWSLGLWVNMNVFDGLQTKSDIKYANATLRSSEREYELATNDIALGVKRAHLDLLESRERIKVAEKAVELGKEDRRLQEERYRLGEGTLLELNDSLVALTEARVSRVQAVYDYHLASARLERAVGRD